jgi:hypothetical protein
MARIESLGYNPSEQFIDSQSKFTPEERAFFTDLETPRPDEEINSLRKAFFEMVDQEQKRLLRETDPDQIQLDIITGDRPFRTKYDRLKSEPVLISPTLAAEAFMRRFYNLWILNHPTRIQSLQAFIRNGYRPPVEKHIPLIEDAINRNHALDFDDIALMLDEPDNPYAQTEDSARKIMSHGPYTWLADNLAAIPYVLSSMPDVSNSLSIATHILSGGLAFVPFDSLWNKPEYQNIVVKRAWEIIEHDPVLQNHPEREFLLMHYKRLLAPTIKVNKEGVDTMIAYVRQGITTFRFYDARPRSNNMIALADEIRKRLSDREFDDIRPQITAFFGQMRGPNISREISNRLRDFIGIGRIIGIGGGGICSTPKESNQHVKNVNDGYRMIRADPAFPTLFDGGVGSGLPVVLAMGGSGALKSGALLGGCIEQPPCLWYYRIGDNDLAKNLAGEANGRTKQGGGKVDFLNRALFEEGASGYEFMRPHALTQTDNVYSLLQSLPTAMVFAYVTDVFGYWSWEHPPIGDASELAKKRASVHQHGTNDRESLREGFQNRMPLVRDEDTMIQS